MKKILAVVILGSMMLSSAYADSMRCGNKLIRTGDAKAYVIETCGMPISDDLVAWEDDQAIHHVAYKNNDQIKILVFKAGVLTAINNGKR